MRKSWLSIGKLTGAWPLAAAVELAGLALPGGEARANLIGNSAPSLSCTSGSCSGSGASLSVGTGPWTLGVSGNSTINSPVPSTTPVSLATLSLNTLGNNPGGTANLVLDLVLNLTSPSGTFTDPIDLTITASGSGASSTMTLSSFNVPDFTVPGVDLSFLSTTGGSGGALSGGNWTVTRGSGSGQTATLTLEANLTAAAPPGVPEPASLGLLATALAGLGAAWGWRRRKTGDDA